MATRKEKAPTRRRPGGRSARVRAAVLRATLEELVANGDGMLTLEGVARRAGVNKTTLYRRWGSRERLLLEAAVETAAENASVPDTGTLRGDLLDYAGSIVTGLATPGAQAIARAMAAISGSPAVHGHAARLWADELERADDIVTRAVSRGETSAQPNARLIVELLIAPIYLRVLLTREPVDPAFVNDLVEAVLIVTATSVPSTRR